MLRASIERRIQRLEQHQPTAAVLEITDADRAQSARELAAWREDQEALIAAARLADPHTMIGHE